MENRKSQSLPDNLSDSSFEKEILNNLSLNEILSGWEVSKIASGVEPLILWAVYGLNHDEIAEVYELSREAVTLRTIKAREELKEILERHDITL